MLFLIQALKNTGLSAILPESIYFSLFGHSIYCLFIAVFTRFYENKIFRAQFIRLLSPIITRFCTRKQRILIFRVNMPSLSMIILCPKLKDNTFSGKLCNSISLHLSHTQLTSPHSPIAYIATQPTQPHSPHSPHSLHRHIAYIATQPT